jgi:hypothetical protein
MRTDDLCREARRIVDTRLICEDCHVKWFVPAGRQIDLESTDCGSCGGRLIPLEHVSASRPVQSENLDARGSIRSSRGA